MEVALNYFLKNQIEIYGTILSLIYLYLSIKQHIGLWFFGFISSAIYIVVFYNSKFYADMTLQVYYLIMSVYGWIKWRNGQPAGGQELAVSTVNSKQTLWLLIALLVITLAYYGFLVNYTDSPIPIGDSFTTALCVVGTWMLTRKMIENWITFILADSILVGLFIYKSLYPTAILYAVYTIMAIVGYFQWRKSLFSVETQETLIP